jgi:hypothetical protein
MSKGSRIVLAAVLFASPTLRASADETIGEKVVKFCKERLGEKVGSGQCSSLVDEALKAAGGKQHFVFKDTPRKDDYVWGSLELWLEAKENAPEERKKSEKGVQPGDVIQLRDVKFEGKVGKGGTYFLTYPHHTAVVKEVKDDGKVLVVYEQNVNGQEIVKESTYKLNDLKAGWLRIYRPVRR